MSIGSLGASLNIYGSDLKVVWIDAHADINTICTSLSDNVHGMPLAFLTGIDSSDEYYMQHTGTKADRGLKKNALLKFINMFCHTANIVNIDLAELNL